MYKQDSEFKSVQKKLMAAVAMVLIASIMVVSSSYAWFTLSTAPEVTGITTSVGSNGNLEMALRTGDIKLITTSTGEVFPEANEYWGNLVNLSDASYGLSSIALAPARLNTTSTNGNTYTYEYTVESATKLMNGENELAVGDIYSADGREITAISYTGDDDSGYTYTIETEGTEIIYSLVTTSGFLKTPIYGTDGRVSRLDANTVNGIFDTESGSFSEGVNAYGVRAVGVTSNISPEALALRNAKQTVRQAISNSKTAAIKSLSVDAAALANLIVQAKLNSSYSYTETDYNTVQTAITNLEAIVVLLEDAMKEAVVAVGLSQGQVFTADDVTLSYADSKLGITIAGGKSVAWTDTDETLNTVLVNAKAGLDTAMGTLEQMKSDLANAKTGMGSGYTADWDATTPLASILSQSDIEIVDKQGKVWHVSDGTAAAPALLDSSTVISLVSGIYHDIALFSGNYSATGVNMSVDFAGTSYAGTIQTMNGNDSTVYNLTVNMASDADEPTNGYYLEYVKVWMESLSVEGGSSAALITDMYGYVIDLAFQTNAVGSSLLLQTEGTSRVGDDTTAALQGAGSYMEFDIAAADYTLEQMVQLMKAVRVVFTNDDGTIYGIAALDMSAESKEYTSVSSETQLKVGGTHDGYTIIAVEGETSSTVGEGESAVLGYSYTKVTVAVPNYTVVDEDTIKAELYLYGYSIDTNGVLSLSDEKLSSNVITALEQNTPQAVSALVYLDGDYVENADVAISGNSITGKMNLQFASSADLIPMQYTFNTGSALSNPAVEVNGNVMTITHVENAATYGVYYGDTKIGTVTPTEGASSSTYDFTAKVTELANANTLTDGQTITFTVKAEPASGSTEYTASSGTAVEYTYTAP